MRSTEKTILMNCLSKVPSRIPLSLNFDVNERPTKKTYLVAIKGMVKV